MYEKIKSFAKLAEFGRKILSRPSLDEAIPIIAEYTKELLEAERCSVFIYNKDKNSLWTTLSDGVEHIHIAADQGIAGTAFTQKRALIVNDPYADSRFSSEIDQKTGYTTKNIIAIPIIGAFDQAIGVLQLLNKHEGDFDKEDKRLLTFFNHYISGYVELATLFREENT
jgi:GAF domain-containing protein